jgi:hypothetical protein
MLDLDVLNSIRYVVDQDGRKSAVQVDIQAWDILLSYLEDLEDRALLRDKIQRLVHGPEASGATSWEEIKKEW